MGKRKSINGLPHNITKSFFGHERFYSCGLMSDWLLNAARQLNLSTASLNVLQVSFIPTTLNITPLTLNAKSLKEIIDKELLENGFDLNFIKEAHIDFQFPNPNLYATTIYCFPYLIDKDGKRYESRRLIAEALESKFDPFEELKILAAIKDLFNQ